MTESKMIRAILVVLCSYACLQISGAEMFVKDWTFEEQFTSKSKNFAADDKSFTYGFCSNVDDKTMCTLTVETPIVNNVTYKQMCMFYVNETEKLYHWPLAFNKSINIVRSSDADFNLIIRVIDMRTCEVTYMPTDFNHLKHTVIGFAGYDDGRFDLFYYNKKSKSPKYTLMSYDIASKKLLSSSDLGSWDISPELTVNTEFYPVCDRSHECGYWVTIEGESGIRVYHTYKLKTSSAELMHHKSKEKFAMRASAENKKFGLCWMSAIQHMYHGTKVNCTQFDQQENKVLMNATVTFAKDISLFKVYNLKEGGLLIVTGNCGMASYYNDCNTFNVWRVQPDGRYSRSYEIRGFEFEYLDNLDFNVGITENEEKNEFCFYFGLQVGNFDKPTKTVHLKFGNVCLPKKLLI